MRKVTFYIDDLEWFRKFYNLTDKQMENLFSDVSSFKVIYTLYGYGNYIDRYTLTDYSEKNININSLNGYQRGVILSDCHAYFTGGKYCNNGKEPCGVVRIDESEEKSAV